MGRVSTYRDDVPHGVRGLKFTADGEFHVLESLVDKVVPDQKNNTTRVYLVTGCSVTVEYGKAYVWESLPCCETIWQMGAPYAVCTQPLNQEHSHDRKGEDAVAMRLARLLDPDDCLFAD